MESKSEAGLAGTVEYIAPELFLGHPPSLATDLYSVGVLAFQMFTGSFPYSRDSMTEMLQVILGTRSDLTMPPAAMRLLAHYRSRPHRSSLASMEDAEFHSNPAELELQVDSWRQDVPGPIGKVINKLVAKRPEERYPNAQSALRDLAQAVGGELPVETAATRESCLQATAFASRQNELQVLSSALSKASKRQGCGILVGGESGVGKSRLVGELRTLALVQGLWVVEGQSTTDAATYYQEWLPLLRGLGFRTELSDTQIGVFKELVGDLDVLLGRQIAPISGVSPEVAKQRLAQTLADVLAGLTKPLLLIFEDLQWARSESLELLTRLLTGVGNLPLLILGTYRTEETPALPTKLDKMQSLRLERLSRQGIAQLSESILGEAGKEAALIDYLEQQTEGNVFFLVEVVRALAEDAGELQRIGCGALPQTVLTQGIERLIECRLERVPSAYRDCLELLAIAGRQLDLRVLEVAFQELDTRLLLIECANAGVIETLGTIWQFSHDKLRESCLRKLDSSRITDLHRQVAETMESVYSAEERIIKSGTLAYHYASGQMPEHALKYYIQAGQQAGKLGLLSESQVHYQSAMNMLSRLPTTLARQRQRIDLLLKIMQNSLVLEPLGALLVRGKEIQGFLDDLERKEGICKEDSLRRLRQEYYIGRAYYYNDNTSEALNIYKKVAEKAQEFDDPELKAMPGATIGMALLVQGYLGSCYSIFLKSRAALQEMGDTVELLRIQNYIALSMVSRGCAREGNDLFEQLRLQAIELNQWQMRIVNSIIQIIGYRTCMDWPSIIERIPSILVEIDRLGGKTYTVLAWNLLAWAHGQLENRQESLAAREKARELVRGLGGNMMGRDWWLAGEAEVANSLGAPQEALKLAEAVVELSKALPRPLSWAVAERAWAVALGRLGGSQDEVAFHFQQSLHACTLGELVLDAAQTEFWWARICLERGDRATAQLHIDRAISQFAASGCAYALAVAREVMEFEHPRRESSPSGKLVS